MALSARESFDVVVIGAGPAGVIAALRAARLGARTALLSREELGGLAANTGRALIVHEAIRQGVLAATNAVRDAGAVLPAAVSPMGSFTDPEYVAVGLTEACARLTHDVLVSTVAFDSLPRPIIDGRSVGFCKLVVDRTDGAIVGCHIVGERAVELAQVAAVATAGGMTVERLARVPFSFPTYANALGRAAVMAAAELDGSQMWAVDLPDLYHADLAGDDLVPAHDNRSMP